MVHFSFDTKTLMFALLFVLVNLQVTNIGAPRERNKDGVSCISKKKDAGCVVIKNSSDAEKHAKGSEAEADKKEKEVYLKDGILNKRHSIATI